MRATARQSDMARPDVRLERSPADHANAQIVCGTGENNTYGDTSIPTLESVNCKGVTIRETPRCRVCVSRQGVRNLFQTKQKHRGSQKRPFKGTIRAGV